MIRPEQVWLAVEPIDMPMAVWRRKPAQEVLVHSDQGSQFRSHDLQDFLKAHRLEPSTS